MPDTTLTIAEAHALVWAALTASRTSSGNAAIVADALIGAELSGQGGHGLRRVPAYAAQAKAGKVDGYAVPIATRIRPGAVAIDAANGFAYPALDVASRELAFITPEQGIAAAGIRRSHHAGVAGLVVESLAEKGLVALLFSNAPAAIAPWGGRRPLYGTDPIAFACPTADGATIVVDVSMSKVARGRIMAANQKDEPIPEGWALDAEGHPTTDAKAALAGTMVPLGDAKGTALALMVELLCAGLTGANYAFEQTSFFDAEGAAPGTGQLLIAIDPETFGGTRALDRFAAMAAMVAGTEGARLPGSRRQAIRDRLRRDGLQADAALVREIEHLAAG
ncbi:Ldh family oxidoreductase [Aquibium sp. ELW1220]|uniref:Ldh family oxidoreductase n=1 Tax=Aquibium sp. ELW1220 TaxID=2976766 RepID=UPI0025AF1C38|nr:Ldh family oxidoreductase [Aquibium sp. ELW1220]MDN2582886.1 Ldh family oxidoreductase [Aquibium sp. ELW1220]